MAERSAMRAGLDGQAVLVAAGVADVALGALGAAVGALRDLLGRADGPELAEQAGRDLAARGRLALDRHVHVPPAHLEVLARQSRAAARGAGGGGA
ncbi:polyprenyl synthetase [Streptomyces sp. NPDC021020]|uniref:polyprenyl synthetase n=1 Tax=Streptomyces sp. NPDC021020 TaxID=3365109 RepID=UPI0037943FB1